MTRCVVYKLRRKRQSAAAPGAQVEKGKKQRNGRPFVSFFFLSFSFSLKRRPFKNNVQRTRRASFLYLRRAVSNHLPTNRVDSQSRRLVYKVSSTFDIYLLLQWMCASFISNLLLLLLFRKCNNKKLQE